MHQHLVTVIAVAVAAIATSFAVAQATDPPARTSATDRAVVRQLRGLRREVRRVESAIGTSTFSGLRGETRDYLRGPTGRDAAELLRQICRNTSESFVLC